MKVLVTGGCGLVGYNVAKHYKEAGHEVDVFDNLERSVLLGHEISNERKFFNRDSLEQLGVKCHYIDVSEKFNLKLFEKNKFDVIFHFAAQCGVPPSVKNPERDFQVNALGTFNILEKARRDNSIVVYTSTNKVYPIHSGWELNPNTNRWVWNDLNWRIHGFPKDGVGGEHNLKGSRTPYGVSKYAGDLYCQEYASMYNLKTGIFRCSCLYGPNQFSFEEQGWITWFIIAALKEQPITIYGDGSQVRDVLFLDDLVGAFDAYVKAAKENRIPHGVWNMGGGPKFTLSLNEAIKLIERITNKKLDVSYSDWRPSDQRVYTSDIRQVSTDLNWMPKVTPEQGVMRVTEWVKANVDVF